MTKKIESNNVVKDESKNIQTVEEMYYDRDLGAIFETDLKLTEQIGTSENKANRILGMRSRNFESREVIILKQLYTWMVRLHSFRTRNSSLVTNSSTT